MPEILHFVLCLIVDQSPTGSRGYNQHRQNLFFDASKKKQLVEPAVAP
jgi:hypothetical protein